MKVYQFKSYPRTFGKQPNLSLMDLGEAAYERNIDIPAFQVIVPAFLETDVIEATINRLVSMNYPRTHFKINIVTYEDEPVQSRRQTTTEVAQRVCNKINATTAIDIAHSIVTPSSFDGYFPGNTDSEKQYTSKARGLNYGLRCIHEQNERDERRYLIGKLVQVGHFAEVEALLLSLEAEIRSGKQLPEKLFTSFDPEGSEFIGILPCQYHLQRLLVIANSPGLSATINQESWKILFGYMRNEAWRHFLILEQHTRTQSVFPQLSLRVNDEKKFLYDVLKKVEAQPMLELMEYSVMRETKLQKSRPILYSKLGSCKNSEAIYQLSRRINSRWVLVYDADADAPTDIMRHLAARIMTEPDVMGYQGPVAPVQNYDEVHPIGRMSGLWLAFSHGSSYPRLIHNKKWAHPLAGTNWCFRIEGFERNGRLIRDCLYEESERQFLLKFDPQQLTEDLESGIRMFNDWSVNAEWHPIAEIEQVPPTAGGVFRQHARWTLGTLQTMKYILKSRLPFGQKTLYVINPVGVILAGLGPIITIALVIALYNGSLQVPPAFAWWSLLLAFGNLVYLWVFMAVFERFYDARQQTLAFDCLYQNRQKIIQLLKQNDPEFTPSIIFKLNHMLVLIRKGMEPGGFISKCLKTRYTDPEIIEFEDAGLESYINRLQGDSQYSVYPGRFYSFVDQFELMLKKIEVERRQSGQSVIDDTDKNSSAGFLLLEKTYSLVRNATYKAGVNRFPRWSAYHTQILLWAIPYIYFSLTPIFYAYWCWAKGEKKPWDKTVRTVKH